MKEKYAVVIDDEKTKTAEQQGEMKTCPSCGRQIHRADFCRNCGTEPFEKKPDNK